jgi:hypothetical protein
VGSEMCIRDSSYAHGNHASIIADLDVKHLTLDQIPDIDRMTRVAENKETDTTYINTWVGCWQGTLFPFGEHINFIRLHSIWREYFKHLNLQFIEDPNYYLPKINFDKFDVTPADAWYDDQGHRPTILICNGPANSGQSRASDLTQCITELSKILPDVNLVVTHRVAAQGTNIYFTDDIFTGIESDLNQIAYLAKGADIIVGKNSGPFSYCQNAHNLMNDTITFVNLSLLPTDCPSGGGIYKARCVHTAEINDQRIASIIAFIFNYPDYRGTEILL